jgi:predicted ATPase
MNDLFIRHAVSTPPEHPNAYPFAIPAVRDISYLRFTQPVTFLAGENGSGKSTIIQALAVAAGFNAEGGTKNYSFSTQNTTSALSQYVTLVRGPVREKAGYFLRAESFYTTANYAETGTDPGFGPSPLLFDGKRIHQQSHGEAFLAIIKDFPPRGLYIFDEPESALSPQRLLSLMHRMHELVARGSQFIIATHSPMLLAYPGVIYELSETGVRQTAYDDLAHVQLTRDFLDHPAAYLRHIID